MIQQVNPDDCPNRWILLREWSKRTGYTSDAFQGKRQSGQWIEGKHWIKSPDGKIQIDWREVELWMESNYDATQLEQTRRA